MTEYSEVSGRPLPIDLDDPAVDDDTYLDYGECVWCRAPVDENGWCGCAGQRDDAKAEAAWLRYEEDKER